MAVLWPAGNIGGGSDRCAHKVLTHPISHTTSTLTPPCTTTCSHAGFFTPVVMMGGERHSPWVILLLLPLVWGEIGPQDCIRFPRLSFTYHQIFCSPKNSIVAENCLPGNDSTEWDVNADGDPSIQVTISASQVLLSFQCLPGFCYKIQRCQGRGCPVQDQDRFFKLPTGYLPRWMV